MDDCEAALRCDGREAGLSEPCGASIGGVIEVAEQDADSLQDARVVAPSGRVVRSSELRRVKPLVHVPAEEIASTIVKHTLSAYALAKLWAQPFHPLDDANELGWVEPRGVRAPI